MIDLRLQDKIENGVAAAQHIEKAPHKALNLNCEPEIALARIDWQAFVMMSNIVPVLWWRGYVIILNVSAVVVHV